MMGAILRAALLVVCINVPSGEELPGGSTSWENKREAKVVVRVAKAIHNKAPDASISIMCYYRLQQKAIAAALRDYPRIEVRTVTGYQGREADVTILATSRTGTDPTKCEFVLNPRRSTVGLSRAKEQLIVVGDLCLLHHGAVSGESSPFIVESLHPVCLGFRSSLQRPQRRR